MPEDREGESNYVMAKRGFDRSKAEGDTLQVEALFIDATEAEAKRPKAHPDAKMGLAYAIDTSCTAKRGNPTSQTPIYPPQWKAPGSPVIQSLVLHGVDRTERSLILDFGDLFLNFQYLTHSMPQWLPRALWELSIAVVSRDVRKARVGMAFLFARYTLVLFSSDLVFGPTWRKTREELPKSPSDIYSPSWDFPGAVAEWIQVRVDGNSARNGLACTIIRGASHVFLGIGVYTVLELFFLAGMSPLLTEREVFDSPSRTARLVLAYLQYRHESRTKLHDFLRPAIHDGVLAPTVDQRLRYLDWLYVYGKQYTSLVPRMAALVDDYVDRLNTLGELTNSSGKPTKWSRTDEDIALFDVFEPTLIQTPLMLPHNLGHLVFGEYDWRSLGGWQSNSDDPLTAHFRERGLLQTCTYLRSDYYSPLFLPTHEMSSMQRKKRSVYTFRGCKQLWSITPNFPPNSHWGKDADGDVIDPAYSRLHEITGTEREHMIFSYIVTKTLKVSIGPLEYCGNAHIIHVGRSERLVACVGDASVSEHHALRLISGRERKSGTKTVDATKVLAAFDRKRAREEMENMVPADAGPSKPKKRRINADQRLALATISPQPSDRRPAPATGPNDVFLSTFQAKIISRYVNAVLALDGFTRSTVVADGTFPGPLIRAFKGDTLRVTVKNKLAYPTMRRSTSIDFDGIFFDTPNAYNEGTPFVTTCPIPPGSSYTYVLPLGSQTGTYWYHSQLSMQYADGLRGPLIIYDRNDPQRHLYDVDDENTIWFIADWWHNKTIHMLELYDESDRTGTHFIPVADSGLFNARGRYNGGPKTPFAVSKVQKGKRYRFRIINASARSDFTVSINNHTMTVIAADGVSTVPHTVNVIDVLAGQRYDVVVTANQPVGNYWINSILGGGNPARNLNLNVTFGRGILRYDGARNEEPRTPMTLGPSEADAIPLEEFNLRPLVPIPASTTLWAPPPDVNFSFVTAKDETNFVKAIWTINNISYLSPKAPTLVKILDDGADSNDDFTIPENTFVLPANKVIQVEFPATIEDELHPFHLHGNNFFVVKSNGSDTINTVNPIRRDTSGAGAGGSIFRFTTDRPGPWFFHCHIFWHLSAGLGAVMASGTDETRAKVHPTKEWDRLCDAYNALPPELQ
ncbi:Cupredoxin [Mycena rebaudengoi]|nr:Cupredoxin [Mycena rebaudengoi]